jgi:hypothetical protein
MVDQSRIRNIDVKVSWRDVPFIWILMIQN